MPKKRTLAVGHTYYGHELLEIRPGVCARDTMYVLKAVCCGRIVEFSHGYMLRFADVTPRSVCKLCRGEEHEDNPIYVPGWGWTMGKMGFRHGG